MRTKKKITHVGFVAVKDGVKITSYSQSPRGTRYAVDTILVAQNDEGRASYRAYVQQAVALLMGEIA